MTRIWKMLLIAAGFALLFGAGVMTGQRKYGKPKSVVHVVTLYWKDGTTDEQKKQVFDAAEKLAASYPGIRNVWLKSIKVQGEIEGHNIQNAFVMEFADEQALKDYSNSEAQKEFYTVYLPLRGESRTHDITN